MKNILEIRSLSKSYDDANEKLIILKNINFSLENGKSIFLFGPSGCGKSTFLNLITGLDKPDEGWVSINGKKLKKDNLNKILKEEIGIVFQDHYLLNELNINDNLLIKSEDLNQLNFLIDFLDIRSIINKYPYQLSNGQKQRVCVARSLINKPKLIIADEPTSYLDKVNADNVIRLLSTYSKEFKTSVIISSHDISYKKHFDYFYTIQNMNLLKC